MVKPGRNAPCPCGSGAKYKKCCLPNEEAAAQRASDEQRRLLETMIWENDGLDDLSNAVLDLINEQRFEDALAACKRLLDEWPDVIDGLERSAMVYKAMGQPDKALDFYRRALAFTERDDQRDGFDEPARAYYRERIADIENTMSR